MKTFLVIVAILSMFSNVSCFAQADTIRLVKKTILNDPYVGRNYRGQKKRCIFLSMTTAEDMRTNAAVGEVSYTTKILQYTKKKWAGLYRGPRIDSFLVSKDELQALFSIVRLTNNTFLISSNEHELAVGGDEMTKGSFYVILLEDKLVYEYNLGSVKTAIDYKVRLVNLVEESSIDATTKAGLVKLFDVCFIGLTK